MKHVSTIYFGLLAFLLCSLLPSFTNAQLSSLGVYPNATVSKGGTVVVTPANPPSGLSGLSATTSPAFKGNFVADPATGIIRVTNAYPTGVYSVTVTSYVGTVFPLPSLQRTFTLTVGQGDACTNKPLFNHAKAITNGDERLLFATLGDANNDGKLDLFVAESNKSAVAVHQGDGTGRFNRVGTVSTGGHTIRIDLGDLNSDGRLDMVCTNDNQSTIAVRYGNGNGGFNGSTNLTVGSYPVKTIIRDINRDGKPDLLTGCRNGELVSVFLGSGLVNDFQAMPNVSIGHSVMDIAADDINGDGKLDFVSANGIDGNVSIRLGDGAGGFTSRPDILIADHSSLGSVTLGDINGDGAPELAASNYDGSITLFQNISRFNDPIFGIPRAAIFGNRSDIDPGEDIGDISLADVNNDGKTDIIATRSGYAGGLRIYLGNGSFSFSSVDIPGPTVRLLSLGDINGDNHLDLVAWNIVDTITPYLGCPNALVINAPDLTLTPGTNVTIPIATVSQVGSNPASLSLTVRMGSSPNSLNINNVVNNNGTIRADVFVGCNAESRRFDLNATNGLLEVWDDLQINVAPLSISSQPASASTVVTGSSISTGVSVTATAPLTYQWYQNGQLVSGQTGANLSLTNVQPTNAGTYRIVVTSPCTSLTSTPFNLSVTTPFGITPLPVFVSRNGTTTAVNLATLNRSNGNPANLTVTIGNSTSATNNGVTIRNLTNSNGTVNADITTTCASNPATFVLAVSDGPLSTSATLEVGFFPTPVPLIINQPASSSIVEAGSDVTTSFGIRAGDPVTYQWYRNSTAVQGQNSSTLTLTNVQAGSAGNYYAVATTGCASLTSSTFSLSLRIQGPIRYVRQGGSGTGDGSSWANASADLQAMINDLGAQQIWVATGIYKPTTGTDRSVSFVMKPNVAIYGGFVGTESQLDQRPSVNPITGQPSSSTLSGDIGVIGNNADNSYHVISNSQNGLTNTAILDGFVITGGNANGSGTLSWGGGMLNQASSPAVVNCVFQSNAGFDGAGIKNSQSNPALTNCVFRGNSASRGGGLANAEGEPVLTNCRFLTNSAGQGGGVYNNFYGNPLMINCAFQNNSANDGGGMYNRFRSSPRLVNCSFQDNSAGLGRGMYTTGNGSNPSLVNSVLFGNGGNSTLTNVDGGTVSASYCLFETTETDYAGTNNQTTTTSPFVSTSSVALNICSPAINAGSNTAYATANGPTTDLVGNPRRHNNGSIDTGAVEYQGDPSLVITTPSMTTAAPGGSFNQPFTVLGGSAPYNFTLASGSLPPGLSLSPTGVLSGTLTQTGSFTLTVRAIDANGCAVVSSPYVLQIRLLLIRYVRQVSSGTGDGSSWANASADLQAMINAPDVREVWVAAGTYKPTSTTARDVSFVMKNGVFIYGGYPDTGDPQPYQRDPASSKTILSGDIGVIGNDADNSYHVISNIGNGLNSLAILDGFVITGGNANRNIGNSGRGGGMINVGSSPWIRDCVFQNNKGDNYGGGLFNMSGSSPILTNCSFLNNTVVSHGGGICNLDRSSPSLTNCLFQGNSASQGGGMSNEAYCNPRLVNCSFENNVAGGGGGMYNISISNPNLINCSFVNNSSRFGGGGMSNVDNSDPTLLNCSFQGNSASGNGGGLYNLRGSNPILTNCALFGNGSSNTLVNLEGATVSASHCLFEATETDYTGTNNLTTTISPFASASSVALNACSSAINAGNDPAYSSGDTNPSNDLVGNSRFVGSRIDIGAIEFQGDFQQPVSITSQPLAGMLVAIGSTVTTSVSVSGSSGITYQWYKDGASLSSQTSATLTLSNAQPSDAGSYSVVVTSTCNSVTSTAFSLSVNAAPLSVTLTATPITLLTTGTTTLSAAVTGGTSPYSYTFTGPGTINENGSTAAVTGLPTGVQTFTVSIADATTPTAQTATAIVSVTVNLANTAPMTTGITNQTATVDQSFSLNVASVFNDAETPSSLAYAASGLPPGLSLTGSIITGSPSVSGVTTVTLTATDPGSLSVSTSFTLTVQPASVSALTVAASASPSTLLTTGTTTLSAVVTGGTAPYSYMFTGPGTISANDNTAQVSGLPVGIQSFSVLVIDASMPTSQTTSATVSVTVSQPIPVNTAPTTTGIANQTATVGQPFSLNVASAFTDGQTPNALTLTAIGLPSSLVLGNGLVTGTPSTTGVSQVTITATDPGSLTVSANFQLTVNAPASTTTSVPFAITGVTTVSCQTVTTGLRQVSFTPQYAGLTGQPVSFSVANELAATTQPGPYTLNLYTDNPTITLRAVQASSQASFTYNWLSACSITAPANRPPTVANPITNQMATQNQPFSFQIPVNTFTDADGDALSLSVLGLPQNLNLVDTRITGTPSLTGVSQVTITASDGRGGTVSTNFQLTVNAPTSTTITVPFAIKGVTTVSCQTVTTGLRQVSFTPQYAGLTGQPVSFSVANELAATTQLGPYTLNLYTDNPSITLRAVQAGTQVSFNYDWLAACSSTTLTNQAPTVLTPIANQAATVNQPFNLVIPANTFADDAGAAALTLSVSGLPNGLTYRSANKTISGTPTSTTMATVKVRATDAGNLLVETSFVLTVSEPTNTTSTVPFSITGVTTVNCQTVTTGLRQVSFTPQYAGLTGQPVSFSVANELAATTQPGPYTLNLYTDNPTITLRAVQASSQASFTYNWLATCGNQANARVAVDQQTGLSVRVLGNPTADETVTIEVRGVAGQPLRLWVTDLQGHAVSERSIEQAPAVGQYSLPLGRSAGNYLLRVSTPIQTNVVKIVRQ